MHHITHMLSQVMLCFNWLWVIFLHLAANLWPRSPPTGQIFCENCNLTTDFPHMRVGPLQVCHAASFYSERVTAFLSFSVSLLYPHLHLHFIFPTLCLQSVLPSVRAECVCVYLRGSSTVSGPHLSAFTVPTFPRAGFIGELGPVKTLPCTTMCAHDGVCSLACVSKIERLLGMFCVGVHNVKRTEKQKMSASLVMANWYWSWPTGKTLSVPHIFPWKYVTV